MSVPGASLDTVAELVRARRGSVPTPGVFVIAVDGAVSVGKSTTARLVGELLDTPPDELAVHVISTDGFLFPNRVLEARGLLMRKGFPESYDHDALEAFVASARAPGRELRVPVYSHEDYDVLDEPDTFPRPDVLLVEGLHTMRLADQVDLTVYVDADEADIERWYTERFLALTATRSGFYAQFSSLPATDLLALARQVWDEVNAPNLHQFILPNRDRAAVVVTKGPDHTVVSVTVRD